MSLKRIIRNWLLKDEDCKMDEPPIYHDSADSRNDPAHDINITITVANGGHVVRFSRYNTSTHNMDFSPYVIPDGADFGVRLSELITLEALKNS